MNCWFVVTCCWHFFLFKPRERCRVDFFVFIWVSSNYINQSFNLFFLTKDDDGFLSFFTTFRDTTCTHMYSSLYNDTTEHTHTNAHQWMSKVQQNLKNTCFNIIYLFLYWLLTVARNTPIGRLKLSLENFHFSFDELILFSCFSLLLLLFVRVTKTKIKLHQLPPTTNVKQLRAMNYLSLYIGISLANLT